MVLPICKILLEKIPQQTRFQACGTLDPGRVIYFLVWEHVQGNVQLHMAGSFVNNNLVTLEGEESKDI